MYKPVDWLKQKNLQTRVASLFGSTNTPRTIRFRLLTLIALIILPLILLFGWALLRVADLNRQIIELHRSDVTNRVTSAVDRDIAEVVGMLTGIAGSDDLKAGNFASFESQARILVRQPHIQRIWAFDKSGKYVAGASSKDPALSNVTDGDIANRVFDGNVVVSGVDGEGGKNSKVVVAVPARDGNNIAYGVAADVLIAHLSNLFVKEGLESDWVAAIIDRDGRFVARSLDAGNRLGQLARPELGEAARNPNRIGSFENTTYEGVQMLNAYRRSQLTDWTTVVAVPFSEIEQPNRQAVAILILGGFSIIFITLALTSFLASRISRPVKDISQYATSLAMGKPFDTSSHRILELEEVRAALDKTMAHAARLSALVASAGDAIISVDLDGTIRSWNEGAEKLFGFKEHEIIGQPKTIIVPDDQLEQYRFIRNEVLEGHSLRVETQRRRKDGSIVDVSHDSAPIKKPDGTIFAISSILHDITDRKESEKHQKFLLRELAHRSKNQLAIIQAIAGQTARGSGSTADFLAVFNKRLQGLSASHDLLTAGNWTSVSLADLIRSQLSVFVDCPSEKVTAVGPVTMLTPVAAEAIGLALHELATNSAKYGALSVAGGHISISWVRSSNAADLQTMSLDWRESGGPPVSQPERRGFGTRVVERMVPQSLNGTAQFEFNREGVHWHLEWPLAIST